MIKVQIGESNRCHDSVSALVSFQYDNRIINTVKGLPERYWNQDIRKWEIPVHSVAKLIAEFPDERFDIEGFDRIKPKSFDLPENFAFKTEPFSHQITGFEYGLKTDRWLLGDEQGLGKTKQVIDIAVAKKLQRGYKHCLIICGVNGLKWNWRNEIATHSNEQCYILGQRAGAHGVTVGSNADKLADVSGLAQNESYFIVTNIESFRDESIVRETVEACKKGLIGMIAFDECHKAKNPSSQQGKGILKLQAETMIAMTGTPLMNNPMDLYIILKWLGYENHSFYSFRNHFCVMGGFGGHEIMGYKNMSQLQDKLDSIMVRRLKQDVLDLPEKTHINEYVEMTPKQLQVYNEVKADIQANIDVIKTSTNPLAQLIRLRQATGYTGVLSSTIKESAKLDRMEELVDEAVSNGKKVVIFSNWTQITTPVMERLCKKYYCVKITGEYTSEARERAKEEFQTNENCKVIIGTIGAMGTGITLTAGTVEIFMDEPWNKALKDQAEDRCHRVGTTENITIYTLLCKDTIDERINDLVLKKGLMADAIVDGKVAVSNEELLNFLLN